MWKGEILSINIARDAGGDIYAVDEIRAIPGKGLQGDRYFKQSGTYPAEPGKGREVTLIEIEAIQALESEQGIRLSPGDARRNLVTKGVPLNHLVDKEFNVGEVRLKGVRLCEPCSHLAKLTDEKVLPGLVHRGGLRAEIILQGTIRVGDIVEE
jgi:MOSC domain-containing protein YiiM